MGKSRQQHGVRMEKITAKKAMESASRWFDLATAGVKQKDYDGALYCLEMSLEIGMKAVLLSRDKEVPKTHNILDAFVSMVNDDKIAGLIGRELEGIKDVFNMLIKFRSISGYMFESTVSLEDLKKVIDRVYDKVKVYLNLFNKIVG